MSWTVNQIEVGYVKQNNKQGFFGINQHNVSTDESVEGNFVTEIWNEDRTTFIIKDVSNPLPPTRGSGDYLFTVNIIPNTNLQIYTYYTEGTSSQKISEKWTQVNKPSEGWNTRSLDVQWSDS